MSLIDRYIAEVGRHLPEKDRSDIEAEIRSIVEDMLEERGHRVTSAEDKMIAETLEGLGDPRLLAARYAPPKHYLIGPAWYDFYITTLRRVLFTALPIFAVVTFIITLTENPLDFINAVGDAVGGAFNIGVQILFWVTSCLYFWNALMKYQTRRRAQTRGHGPLRSSPGCPKSARSALLRP